MALENSRCDNALKGIKQIGKVDTTKTLKTVIKNLHLHPGDEKYMQLKLSNEKIRLRIGSVPSAMELLASVGFVREDDLLRFPAGTDLTALPVITQKLDEIVQALSQPRTVSQSTADPWVDEETGAPLSMKARARREAEERKKAEARKRLELKEAELKKIRLDKEARKDPNWKPKVSASAAKTGKAMPTFRDRMGEDGGG